MAIEISSFVKIKTDHKSRGLKGGKDWKDFPCSKGDIGQVIEYLDASDGPGVLVRLESIGGAGNGIYCKMTLDELEETEYKVSVHVTPEISQSEYRGFRSGRSQGQGRGASRQEYLPTYEEILEEGLE